MFLSFDWINLVWKASLWDWNLNLNKFNGYLWDCIWPVLTGYVHFEWNPSYRAHHTLNVPYRFIMHACMFNRVGGAIRSREKLKGRSSLHLEQKTFLLFIILFPVPLLRSSFQYFAFHILHSVSWLVYTGFLTYLNQSVSYSIPRLTTTVSVVVPSSLLTLIQLVSPFF